MLILVPVVKTLVYLIISILQMCHSLSILWFLELFPSWGEYKQCGYNSTISIFDCICVVVFQKLIF